eukprot:scaffold16083_cov77-Skeletonema_marinoi.AAC.2
MKFIKIATISFLAGNAVVAATPTYSAECEKAGADLQKCVIKAVANSPAKITEWLTAASEAEACIEAAAEDEAAMQACGKPIETLLARDCPDGLKALMTACDESSSVVFEDFAFNLAEELVSTAYAYGLRGSAIEEE